MLLHLPDELKLQVLISVGDFDLFEMRRVNKYYKALIEQNLPYFYLRFNKIFKGYFNYNKNELGLLTVEDFKEEFENYYKDKLVNQNFPSFFYNKIQSSPLYKLRITSDLFINFNTCGYFTNEIVSSLKKKCELDYFKQLKEIGIGSFFCKQIVFENDVNDDTINGICKLKKHGFSDFWCEKLGLNLNSDGIETILKIYKICKNEFIANQTFDILKQISEIS